MIHAQATKNTKIQWLWWSEKHGCGCDFLPLLWNPGWRLKEAEGYCSQITNRSLSPLQAQVSQKIEEILSNQLGQRVSCISELG